MADTFTPYYNLVQPTVGGDPDTWGTLLNENFGTLDTVINGASGLANGQCRLTYVSTTQCALVPLDGNALIINGVTQYVPSAGVTISNSGLAASTLYYVYAYMNGSTMTLETSTTGYSAAANGVKIKTGDATRSLVGMLYTTGTSTFLDDDLHRYTASYYKRVHRSVLQGNTVNSTASTTATPLAGTVGVVTWPDESILVNILGQTTNNTANTSNTTTMLVDGAQAGVATVHTSYAGGAFGAVAYGYAVVSPSVGFHTVQMAGLVSGGTGTWSIALSGLVG